MCAAQEVLEYEKQVPSVSVKPFVTPGLITTETLILLLSVSICIHSQQGLNR